jgi:hypothetical protein
MHLDVYVYIYIYIYIYMRQGVYMQDSKPLTNFCHVFMSASIILHEQIIEMRMFTYFFESRLFDLLCRQM